MNSAPATTPKRTRAACRREHSIHAGAVLDEDSVAGETARSVAIDYAAAVTSEPSTQESTRRARPVLAGVPVRRSRSEKIPLSPPDRGVLALVDATRTIDDIAEALGFSARETAVVLLRLQELGVIELHPLETGTRNQRVDDPELECSELENVNIDDGWDLEPATARPPDDHATSPTESPTEARGRR
jgi:hypothetical protein